VPEEEVGRIQRLAAKRTVELLKESLNMGGGGGPYFLFEVTAALVAYSADFDERISNGYVEQLHQRASEWLKEREAYLASRQ
jgi:hypothetical protein